MSKENNSEQEKAASAENDAVDSLFQDPVVLEPAVDPKIYRNRSLLISILPRPARKTIRRYERRLERFKSRIIERIADTDRKRHSSAMVMAGILNAILLSSMALFGTFRIFIPNAPPSTINISLVSQAAEPIYTQLRDPAVIIEPEPDPELVEPEPEIEPEIEPELAEPELEPEPVEPEPEPEPEPVEPEPEPEPAPPPPPEPEPEPVEAQAEPEPVPEPEDEQESIEPAPELDLLIEDVFEAPAEIDEQPLIPEPVIVQSDPIEEVPLAELDPTGPEAPLETADDPQTPVEEAEPLFEVGERAEDDSVGDNDTQTDDNLEALEELIAELDSVGEDEEEAGQEDDELNAAEEVLTPAQILEALQNRNRDNSFASNSTSAVSGDDAFDEEPVFGSRAGRIAGLPRRRLPLVELPEIAGQTSGAAGALAGANGIVAIFCEEQFTDSNKIAECAGRVQILSGWQPGDSGEDYSRAISLIREAQRRGRGNTREFGVTGEDIINDPLFGPVDNAFLNTFQRRAAARTNTAQQEAKGRGLSSLNDVGDPTAGSISAAESGLDIGPGPLGRVPVAPPSRTIRDVRKFERDQRKLEEERRELERSSRDNDDDQ